MRITHPLRPAVAVLLVAPALSATLTAPTAAARPKAKTCANYIYAKSIKVTGTSCSAADHALANGTFSGSTNEKFSSPEWKCSGTGKRPSAHYTCTKKRAKLRFTA